MKLCKSILEVCMGSLSLGLLLVQAPVALGDTQIQPSSPVEEPSSEQESAEELCRQAKLVTVKVLRGEAWGSGFLVRQNGSRYSLVTNGHVLGDWEAEPESFTVQTYDGQQHQAQLLARFDRDRATGSDLAVLEFDSAENYPVSPLGRWVEGEKVLAAGFPLSPDFSNADSDGFACTPPAQPFLKLDRPMQKGYQLGYFFSIPNGMSGGPLLDRQGQVVGINGMGNSAILRNPDLYLYRDGSRVSESLSESLGFTESRTLDLLYSSSWAIPSETIVELASGVLDLTPQALSLTPHRSVSGLMADTTSSLVLSFIVLF